MEQVKVKDWLLAVIQEELIPMLEKKEVANAAFFTEQWNDELKTVYALGQIQFAANVLTKQLT